MQYTFKITAPSLNEMSMMLSLNTFFKKVPSAVLYHTRGQRHSSEVKSTDCPSRAFRFSFQHLQGSSQLSVTPVPGDPMPSLSPMGCRPQMVHRQTYRQKIHTYTHPQIHAQVHTDTYTLTHAQIHIHTHTHIHTYTHTHKEEPHFNQTP